jgi:hypothetical protein
MDPDDAMRRMTLRVRIDGSPKWLPVNADGTHWQFRSWRDRLLGDVIKVEREDSTPVFLAEKLCCRTYRDSSHIEYAARHVESTLMCENCKRLCPR